MAMLVHLAPAKLARRIERSGLRGSPRRFDVEGAVREIEHALFAMPHVGTFWVTHQWMRELRRWGRGELVAVDFRLSTSEEVLIGRNARDYRSAPLARAIAAVREDPLGAEIVVPRVVSGREIVRIRRVRQDVGWIEDPRAHPTRSCVCPVCLPRGTPDLRRRLRAHVRNAIALLRAADDDDARRRALAAIDDATERMGDDPPDLSAVLALASHPSAQVRDGAAWVLRLARTEASRAAILAMLDANPSEAILDAAAQAVGLDALDRWIATRDHPELHARFVESLPWLLAPESADRILARYERDDRYGLAEAARGQRSVLGEGEGGR